MQYGKLAAFALAGLAMAVTGCQTQRKAKAEPAPTPQPAEKVVEVRTQAYTPGTLRRPSALDASMNWSGQALPTGDPATSVLSIEKFTPGTVNVNASYDYTVRVRNISASMMLTDIVVTDRLPASGYTYESSSPAGKASGGTLAFDIGTLNAGDYRDIVIRGKATKTGSVTNCADVVYTPRVCVSTDVVAASLEVQKKTPLEVVLCEQIPITVTVRNPGTGVANNVRVVDTLPEGWTVDGRNTVTWDVGSLNGGESRELTATAKASKTGTFTNNVTATADGGLEAKSSTQTAVRQAILAITKTASNKTQILGRNTTFTVTIENTGDMATRDLVLRDVMTGAENVVAVSDGGTVVGANITWNLGSLAPGAKRSMSVTANRSTEGMIENSVTATAYCADDVKANASTRYIGIPAVLLEVVDDPDPIVLNGTTTYTITVTNQGTAKDTNLVIECQFEDGVEFVSAGGATRHTVTGKTIKFAALPSLAAKAEATWTVVVKGTKPADTRFATKLTTNETSRPIEETESTRFYE